MFSVSEVQNFRGKEEQSRQGRSVIASVVSADLAVLELLSWKKSPAWREAKPK